tara:strand:+ start:100 stop:891 length:792 start_codon:yes stop_codon:yes gene_type:complete
VIAQFAIRLICGMSLSWCLTPRKQVTDGFFRIQMLIVLGLGVLTALVCSGLWGQSPLPGGNQLSLSLGESAPAWLATMIAVLAYVGSFVWALGHRRWGNSIIAIITGLGLLLLAGTTWITTGLSSSRQALAMASELSTSLLLGSAMVSMLLGHWYLTATGMPLEPLARLNTVLGLATVARLSLAATGLLVIGGWPTSDHQVLLLVLRWLAGLLGPLVIVGMVWRILKYRNTQSATGVLYVGVVLALTGELTATLLFQELSVHV